MQTDAWEKSVSTSRDFPACTFVISSRRHSGKLACGASPARVEARRVSACVAEYTHRQDRGVCVLGTSGAVRDIAMASLRGRLEPWFPLSGKIS
jgi:hypothetical protein